MVLTNTDNKKISIVNKNKKMFHGFLDEIERKETHLRLTTIEINFQQKLKKNKQLYLNYTDQKDSLIL